MLITSLKFSIRNKSYSRRSRTVITLSFKIEIGAKIMFKTNKFSSIIHRNNKKRPTNIT